MQEQVLIVDGDTPQDNTALIEELSKQADQFISIGGRSPGKTQTLDPELMAKMMQLWSSQRKSKHAGARALRAKARLAKRNKKNASARKARALRVNAKKASAILNAKR